MLGVAVLGMCSWGAWLKRDAIPVAPFCRFGSIHFVVRAYHFYVRIVAFCKPIDEVLSQGEILTFLGRLREVGHGHSCGCGYCHYCSSNPISVALVAVPGVFEISWRRRSGYTVISFYPAIGLLGSLCRAFVVLTGRYGLFSDARCPRLQRNAVLGMVESFSEWLGLQRGWQKLSHHFCPRQFHSCCFGTGYIQ